jgi:hypothetical protein
VEVAVFEQLRPNQLGEATSQLAVGSPRREGRAGCLTPRMVDADADAAVRAVALRTRVEDVLETAVRVADDRSVPREIEGRARVPALELDPEAVAALVDLQPIERSCDRAPVGVANGDVDGTIVSGSNSSRLSIAPSPNNGFIRTPATSSSPSA